MKVLVTGGTGFIGSHLVDKLYKKGYEVVIISRNRNLIKNYSKRGMSLYVGDLTKKDSLHNIPIDFDFVFHLAAVRDSVGEHQCYKINVEGTRNLLEVLYYKKINLKKFIYISSLSASGLCNNDLPKKETDPMTPVSFYGKTKMMAEEEIISFKGQTPYIILRPSKIYGPGDKRILLHFKFVKYGIVPKLGIKPRLMSLCYIEDLVEAMIMAAESGISNNIYFLSDGEVYSWDKFYNCIAGILDQKVHKIFIPQFVTPLILALWKIFDRFSLRSIYLEPTTLIELKSRYWICDSSKFFGDFCYKPRFDLVDGLQNTAKWFIEKGLL